jgi:Asp/Glu/hydantoin racemase
VTQAELRRRQERYRQLSPPALQIELVNLPDDPEVPRTLDTIEAIRASEHFVYQVAMETDPESYQAILLDCVLDPALDRLERDAALPAFGILKLSAGFLASLGHQFAAVTRNQVIGDELIARLKHYGLAERFERLIVLNLEYEDIADDERWNAAIGSALGQLRGTGIRSLINGCSAVNVQPKGQGIAVVDPTALALRLLSVAVDADLARRPMPVLKDGR